MGRFFYTSFILLILSIPTSSSSNIIKDKKGKGFIVVELFTSEGCSSCPPADEGVIEISKKFKANVFVLGFHVDYWNYLGWKDPFSNPDFSERQKEYASIFSLNSIYTPQIVVNGSTEFVGSDKDKLEAVIDQELNPEFHSKLRLTAKTISAEKIEVDINSVNYPNSNVHIALVQLFGENNVSRGENSGKKLNHINIVREFKTIENNGKVFLTIPKGLSKKDLKVISFVQDKTSFQIMDATSVEIQ